MILDSRVLLCFVQDVFDGVRTQVPDIILGHSVEVPNHRRVSLDDLKEDIVFAQKDKCLCFLTRFLSGEYPQDQLKSHFRLSPELVRYFSFVTRIGTTFSP